MEVHLASETSQKREKPSVPAVTYAQFSPHKRTDDLCLKKADEVKQKELLQQLCALSVVELQKVHWCLSQKIIQDFPPIPPHWLRCSNYSHTADTMVRCYQVGGATKILTEILRLMNDDQPNYSDGGRFYIVALPIIIQAPKADFDPDFVKTHRRKLICRMQHPIDVLNMLKYHQILNTANKEAVSIFAGLKNKTRALVDLVLRLGDEAQMFFCKALSQSEPFLFHDLDHHPISDKKSPLAEMIEFLVSDEFRTFQWLISCDMSEDRRHQLWQADRRTTQDLLEKHLGAEQATNSARSILEKIIPLHSLSVDGPSLPSDPWTQCREKTNADATMIEITPDAHENDTLFRLHHPQEALIRCSVTNLMLEGSGDIMYQVVPWDKDFLSSKGLRPAGPLFKFTLLTGHFYQLHLPHCQLTSGGGQCSLSVAHVTEDRVDFITPVNVTDHHVVVDISSFSCLGLVTTEACITPIRGLVLLFSELSDNPEVDSSLYVLLQPCNVLITQVRNEWRKRNKAKYVECPCECELIPCQTYSLRGQPVHLIQPEHSRFLNYSDYNSFFPSFEVHVSAKVNRVQLDLTMKNPAHRMFGWLFNQETVVWMRLIQTQRKEGESDSKTTTEWATDAVPSVCGADNSDVKSLLFQTLKTLQSDDFKEFKTFLSICNNPLPRCHLEEADRMKTTELMVQKYLPDGAKDITIEILKRMSMNHLADNLDNGTP